MKSLLKNVGSSPPKTLRFSWATNYIDSITFGTCLMLYISIKNEYNISKSNFMNNNKKIDINYDMINKVDKCYQCYNKGPYIVLGDLNTTRLN